MRILLLEDEPNVMAFLRIMLQREATILVECTSAEQALELCSASNPTFDLFIGAVNLQVSSGIEVALQLKAWMPKLKIILMSATPLGTFNEQHKALYNELPSNSVRFLLKPFYPYDLLYAIDSFDLERHSSTG